MSDNLETAVADYLASGDPIKDVATRNSIGKNKLASTLTARGLTRGRGGSFSPEVQAAAAADYRDGISLNAVSEKYGVTRWTLRQWFDVPVGESHDVLTGGEWVRDGLVYRWQHNTAA